MRNDLKPKAARGNEWMTSILSSNIGSRFYKNDDGPAAPLQGLGPTWQCSLVSHAAINWNWRKQEAIEGVCWMTRGNWRVWSKWSLLERWCLGILSFYEKGSGTLCQIERRLILMSAPSMSSWRPRAVRHEESVKQHYFRKPILTGQRKL